MLSSSPVAWFDYAKMATRESMLNTRSPGWNPWAGGLRTQAGRSIWPAGIAQAGWSLDHSHPHGTWTTKCQKKTPPHLCQKGSRSWWSTPNMLSRQENWRTWLPAEAARYNGILQRDMATWPTLKHFKNAGLDVSGCANGHFSGWHVCLFILLWSETINGLTKQSPQIIINRPSKQRLMCEQKVAKQKLEGMLICCEQRTCNFNTIDLSYACMGLHPQLSFMSDQPQTQTHAFKIVGWNRIDQRKVETSWAVMRIILALQCCRAAAYYTLKPAFHTPISIK